MAVKSYGAERRRGGRYHTSKKQNKGGGEMLSGGFSGKPVLKKKENSDVRKIVGGEESARAVKTTDEAKKKFGAKRGGVEEKERGGRKGIGKTEKVGKKKKQKEVRTVYISQSLRNMGGRSQHEVITCWGRPKEEGGGGCQGSMAKKVSSQTQRKRGEKGGVGKKSNKRKK